MAETPRIREITKHETREALLAAGMVEFSARGLSEPSLDAICARAGFTRGAFYVHFRDRDDFISAIMERVLGGFLDAILATGDRPRGLEETIGRFAAALEVLAEAPEPGEAAPFGGPGLHFQRVLEACARSPRIRERFATLLEGAASRVAKAALEGQRSGRIRADLDADVLGSVLVMVALGAVNAVELGIPVPTDAARDTVYAMLKPPGGIASD